MLAQCLAHCATHQAASVILLSPVLALFVVQCQRSIHVIPSAEDRHLTLVKGDQNQDEFVGGDASAVPGRTKGSDTASGARCASREETGAATTVGGRRPGERDKGARREGNQQL